MGNLFKITTDRCGKTTICSIITTISNQIILIWKMDHNTFAESDNLKNK